MHEMFDRILSLRVNDVMTTNPVTVNATDSMADVSRMFAAKRRHSAPVVDDKGRCVGIITTSDFIKQDEAFAGPGVHAQQSEGPNGVERRFMDSVAECMTQGIQTISPSTPLIAAARIMTDAHLHVLPVIEKHKPIGILSNLDVVAALVNAYDEARNNL